MVFAKLRIWVAGCALIGLLGGAWAPSCVFAQNSADLQARLHLLRAQVAQLQAQLAQLQAGVPAHRAFPQIPMGFTFTRDLSLGMTGEDVHFLQIILNDDLVTRVAISGFGSPGDETPYFGNLTRAALIRFQQKYASEILTPQGKSQGTGAADALTRAKLTIILAGIPAASPSAAPSPSEAPSASVIVALAPDTPAEGVIANGSRALFTKFTMTASDKEVQIASVRISRSGLSANADVENIELLDEKRNPVGNSASLNVNSKATITFFPALVIPAASKRAFFIQADVSSDIATGRTIMLGIQEKGDIQAENALIEGIFPLYGKNLSARQVDIASVEVREDDRIYDLAPNVGRKDAFINHFAIAAGDQEAIVIERISALHAGSSSLSDSRNLKLYDLTNKKLIKTVSAWSSDGTVTWDSLNIVLKRGEIRRFRILADIAGGVGKTLNADITDGVNALVWARGLQYGFSPAPVVAGNWDGKGMTDQHIREGVLTIERSDESPKAQIIPKGPDQLLARFDFVVRGEAVRVQTLRVSFDWSEGVLPAHVRDIRVMDEDRRIIAGPQDVKAEIVVSGDNIYEGNVVFTVPFEVPVGATTYSIIGSISPNAPSGGNITVAIADPARDIAARGVTSGNTVEPQPAQMDVRGNKQSF